MIRKTILVLVLCMIALPLTPTEGFSWRGDYRYQKYRHHSRYYYHDDAWVWGIAGLMVGSALTAVVTRPVVYEPPYPRVVYAPRRPAVVYVEPSSPRIAYQSLGGQARIYSYPPEVPPGMCRWERPMLDEYGRSVLDRAGMPAKVYTLGSCEYPPPY